MLSREQQRDMMAAGLLALALFFGAALMPVSILGPRGAAWFPSGNMMGLVGGTTERGLTGLLGGSAFFVPILLLVSGLRACDWLSPGWTVRLSALVPKLSFEVHMGSARRSAFPEPKPGRRHHEMPGPGSRWRQWKPNSSKRGWPAVAARPPEVSSTHSLTESTAVR